MRFLHTSDWHIGRTFHGYSTLEALSGVLDAIPSIVREHHVDAVLVAGDVFDSTTPSGAALEVLTAAIRAIRAAGAVVVLSSGNHDSAARLGFQSEWAAFGGVHVRAVAGAATLQEPVLLTDEHGEVAVYGIPYLEPLLLRGSLPEGTPSTQAGVLEVAMDAVRTDAAARGVRSLVLAHCFAGASLAEAEGLERDITAGGLDIVPTSTFEGVDYAALGHIHGRQTLTDSIRYSGAPLHFTFGEGGKPRGGWLVDVGAGGLERVTWVDLPVPREMTTLRGTLDELLASPAHAPAEQHWVRAVLTDDVRPLDSMRRLQQRFPYCALIEFAPSSPEQHAAAGYAARVSAGRSDTDLVDGFLAFVRRGNGLSDDERDLVTKQLAQLGAES
ncbi:exonuclease sbcCD subunit D [Pseudoclavibacter sp. AY1F1]|uniref:exonuclease SbcCD subunit D n=1 Tax=Pseudoclavibacter sp. AY1F1 TaxID=2080583 RepID=UPI000CE8FBDB|nr:exonuclease SbcCD subunit D [Pseudoclavibacter sp. AY1F1]PPF42540.1 exonuclease sbcCD subunit D [Pseudoclavibacter sp. AY1F1]